MAPIYEAETVCLGVAIDHRIRRLLKPVEPKQQVTQPEPGLHLSILDARGRELRRSNAEISVTRELAGPSSQGGILVALQQPRHNHPFDAGVDAVIDDCNTLTGLDELFLAASCGTLSIRANVTVIDMMPFIPEATMKQMTDDELRHAFDVASRAVGEKKPQVVLCAGKLSPPRWRSIDARKVETYKLESCGVGKIFGGGYEGPSLVRYRGEGRSLFPIQKINSFHLSFALNYRPHYSCLRQLQLLSVVEACRTLSGTWQDDTWMSSIRDACATVAADTNTSPSRTTGKAGAAETPKPKTLFLPECEKMYSANLRTIRGIIDSFTGGSDLLPGLYDTLVEAKLTQTCNDAVLILREMAKLKARGWAERFDQWNKDTLRKVDQNTYNFVGRSLAGRPRYFVGSQLKHGRLAGICYDARMSLGNNLSTGEASEGLDLNKAADTFLQFTVKLEKLLLDLLEQETAIVPVVADDGLANALSGMKIAAKEPSVQVKQLRRKPVPTTVKA